MDKNDDLVGKLPAIICGRGGEPLFDDELDALCDKIRGKQDWERMAKWLAEQLAEQEEIIRKDMTYEHALDHGVEGLDPKHWLKRAEEEA